MGDLLFNPVAQPGDVDYGNLYIAVGDGGDSVCPHDGELGADADHAALSAIAGAIAGHMNTHGSRDICITLETDVNHFVKKVTQKVGKGQARLMSSNSIRLTRRSV